MKAFTLKSIDTSFSCYNQFTGLYNELKEVEFDTIDIHLEGWFGANMSAVLGGMLDKVSVTNSTTISSRKPEILSILKKNNFLANYGHRVIPDTNDTTIKYLKLKPLESRYFNSYIND